MAAEYENVVFHDDRSLGGQKIYVMSCFPKRAAFGREFIEKHPFITLDGDRLSVNVENGNAIYRGRYDDYGCGRTWLGEIDYGDYRGLPARLEGRC